MSDILTYDTIRKIHKEEESTTKLSKIPDDFFDKIKEYVKSLKESLRVDPSAAQEFQNVKHHCRFRGCPTGENRPNYPDEEKKC